MKGMDFVIHLIKAQKETRNASTGGVHWGKFVLLSLLSFHRGDYMKPSFRQKFRYRFDNLMSRGTPAMIGMLFVLSLAVVFTAGAVISMARFVQEGEQGRIPFG